MMIQTKKTILRRVLGSWLLILLLVGLGGTQPATTMAQVLISSANTDRVFRYDVTTGSSSTEAFIIPQNLGLAGPRGLILGPDANLYVISRDTDAVLRYDGTTGTFIDTFVPKESGGLSGPTSLAFGPDNHLYVNSGMANQVLRYDGMTGAFIDIFVGDDPATPAINEAGSLLVPRGMIFGPDVNSDTVPELYVSSRDSDEVLHYDGSTGAFLGAFVTDDPFTPFDESGGLEHPTGLTFGPDNNLYVNSFDTTQVLRYDATGTFTGTFATLPPSTQPVGIAFGPGPTPNLYVSSFTQNEVLNYDSAGTFLGRFVTNDPATQGVDETGGLSLAAELIFDAAGNLLVSSAGSNQVLRYDGTTGQFQDVFAPLRPVQINEPAGPTGMAFSPTGDLFVASIGTNRVLRYDGVTGGFISVFVADDPETIEDESGELSTPAALAFDAVGNLYVSSFDNNRVIRYDATGLFVDNFVFDDPTTPALDESGGLSGPVGMAFDPAGNFYLSSRLSGNVLRYDANGTFTNRLIPTNGTLGSPTELAFAPDGVSLYLSESEDTVNAIRHFNVTTGELIETIEDASGVLNAPRGLAVLSDGSLLVNSSGSNQVLRYDSVTGLFEVVLENDTLPEGVGRLARPVGLLPIPALQPPPATMP